MPPRGKPPTTPRRRRPAIQSRAQSEKTSRLLAALAEPERLRIVLCLEEGPPRSVGEICRALSSSLANVSHHLQHLRRAGLVRRERRGRYILYSLAPTWRRPPGASTPAALDVGICRVELGRHADAAFARTAVDAPAKSDSRARAPKVEGRWVGHWEPSGAANASLARGAGRSEIACVVEPATAGAWRATFEGESGHAYKFTVEMLGRRVGNAVLFQGSTDLGPQNGGVFDWLGRATAKEFVGYYSSAHYTGVFSLHRDPAPAPVPTPRAHSRQPVLPKIRRP